MLSNADTMKTLMMRIFFASFFIFIHSLSVHAQDRHLHKPVSAARDESLAAVLHRFEKIHSVRFFYLPEWLQPIVISQDYENTSLQLVLNNELAGTGIDVAEAYGYAIIFIKDATQLLRKDSVRSRARQRNELIDFVTIGRPNSLRPGSSVTIRGIVRDSAADKTLPGGAIYVNELSKGYATDDGGKFDMVVPVGNYMLTVRFPNYQEKMIHLEANASGELKIFLTSEAILLNEIEISGVNMLKSTIGKVRLNLSELYRSPTFLGEADIIRQIQTQSGVTTVSEASSGFNVRGGSVDQNLVLFDGTPIFNTAHALGFFTAFNSNTIQETSFYKGNIPAEYGGRISSVLDIHSREGNYKKWEGVGGLGLVASNLYVSGPLIKNKSSLAVSMRSSYSDWMLGLVQTRFKSISEGSVFFYDANIKYANKINDKGKLTASAYFSRDRFSLASDTVNRWNNLAASLRYDRKITDELVYSAGFYLGQYDYSLEDEETLRAFDLQYKIFYPTLKLDFNRSGKRNQSFGLHVTGYNFSPGELSPGPGSQIVAMRMPNEKSLESAVYFSENFTLTQQLEVEAGIRFSMYNRLGAGAVYHYRSDEPREVYNIIDSTMYGAGEIMKTYVNPEPRIGINYLIDAFSTFKLGYNRSNQYLHLVTNTAAVTPVDIWQSSNSYFRPQQSDQVSGGYFRHSKNGIWEYSVESYYKWQRNALEFKDGARLILNRELETSLVSALGRAYGVELTLYKIKGKTTGGLNYTYARSLRKSSSPFENEVINRGDWFPSNMDQPHVANLYWRHNITKRVFFSGNFTYHTGRPVSVPTGAYSVQGNLIMDFDERNNYRIPDFHRLDLSFVIEGSARKNKKFENSWLFSIYNVYGRKNPYSVFFVDVKGFHLTPYQLSLIGTAVPSITYQFKF